MADPLDNLTSSEQLRRLLLQEEQARIDRLEARLGDDETLRGSLVPIIADVLRDAGVKDYHRLAGALAPIVVQSIKTEIHNSRDMMVDALYPITGRLVAAAVRNAFKDLVDQLNSRLDSTLSVDRWRAKLKAVISGRSEAEILLSEGAAFEIIDLLLINRQSGLLIARAGIDAEQGGMDSNLLGSILTAIMAFVRDAMSQSSEQDLRTLHVGDMRLHLQVSPSAVLAVKTKGPPPSGFETKLNETFYAFLSRWGGLLGDPDQIESHDEMALAADLEERFQSLLKAKQSNFRGASGKGSFLLGALASLAVFWIGWVAFNDWSRNKIEATARTVIAQQTELVGYPIEVHHRLNDDMLVISGLLPSQEAIGSLRGGLERAFPDTAFSMDVGALPDQAVDQQASAIRTELAQRQEALRTEVFDGLDIELLSLSEKIAGIERRLPTSSEAKHAALRSWLDRQSIRFGDGNNFDDAAQAKDILKKIAERLSGLPAEVSLRVVGYGDDLGDEYVTSSVSQSRAVLVADQLRGLGIPPIRLQVVGRGKERRIDDADGPDSINRRVEFELTHSIDRSSPDGKASEADHGAR
ncbi:MAG: OmpA family protein [Geminicoccaceae bacterium]